MPKFAKNLPTARVHAKEGDLVIYERTDDHDGVVLENVRTNNVISITAEVWDHWMNKDLSKVPPRWWLYHRYQFDLDDWHGYQEKVNPAYDGRFRGEHRA